MKTIISCVVDADPKYLMQAWNLSVALGESGILADESTEFLIHYTESIDRDRLIPFEKNGARLRKIEKFGDGNAVYCNKLRQLEGDDILDADFVLLLDADVLPVSSFGDLLQGDKVRAKIVDAPNPPERIWRRLFESAGFDVADVKLATPDFGENVFTPITNCNGGVYLLPRAAVAALRESWPRWSLFCLANADLLEKWAHHSDQLGFALAMHESGLEFEPLDIYDNFPTHFPAGLYSRLPEKAIRFIHYHDKTDNHGFPVPIGIPWVDRQISEANERIRAYRRSLFDNRIFWDFRYRHDPALGSGIGSRGAVLDYKRAKLAPYLRIFADRPVVDVGCGDLETTRLAPLREYLGLDLSPEALSIARHKRPDWKFSSERIETLPANSGSLVLCLDVLIHLDTADQVEGMIDGLLHIATNLVILSGFDEPPETSGIVFHHVPVSTLLAEHPDVDHVIKLGEYRGLVLLAAVKRGAGAPNKHDIGYDDLAWGVAHCPTPALLMDLVTLSRTVLGFFPQTIIRTLEYPWLASRLRDCAGLKVLDVGAGVSALPLWLAAREAHVTTVDNSVIIRTDKDRVTWNEWGFLDYSEFGDRLSSHNLDILALEDYSKYDVIYSISVIEHMPASDRRKVIAHIARMLRHGGRLLLTLDLVPGTTDLWPLAAGEVVDLVDPHGNLSDVITEIEAVGFSIFEQTTIRHIPNSRTDIVFLDCGYPAPLTSTGV